MATAMQATAWSVSSATTQRTARPILCQISTRLICIALLLLGGLLSRLPSERRWISSYGNELSRYHDALERSAKTARLGARFPVVREGHSISVDLPRCRLRARRRRR